MQQQAIQTMPVGDRTIKMSYEDYCQLDYEHGLTEWVEGEVILFMAPTRAHQSIVGFLFGLLLYYVSHFKLGEVYTAPFEMNTVPEKRYREPDIAFIATAYLHLLNDRGVAGAASLVVEVVSPESVRRDYKEKREEYEKAGVCEYWVIDSRFGKEQFICYVRSTDGKFIAQLPDSQGRYHSTVIPGFWLLPRWLFQVPIPDPKTILNLIAPEIMRDEQALQQAKQQGIERGIQQGIQHGQCELIIRMLTRRFGELDNATLAHIQAMPTQQRELLTEALLDFSTLDDVYTWLHTHATC